MEYESIEAYSQLYSVSIANSRAEALFKGSREQATVRVYDSGRIGVAGQMGKYDMNELHKRARNALSLEIPYPCMLFGGVREEDSFREIIPAVRLLPEIKDLLFRLKEKIPGFILSNRVNLRESRRYYTNSAGARMSYRGGSLNLSIVLKDKDSFNIMDGSYNCLTDKYDGDGIFEDIIKWTVAYARRVELPAGQLPVILDLSLIELLLKDFMAQRYSAGAGLLNGKLNKRIFNEKMNVLLDSMDRPNTCFFDAEGTVKQNDQFYLVKNGVLSGLLTSKRTAKQFGLPLSGSAAAAFDGTPYAGAGGLTIKDTSANISEAFKGRGIFVCMSSGGDMTGSGDVGMPVQLAFLYEDGRLVGRLPELMLSGNIFEILDKGFMGCSHFGPFNYSEGPVMACVMDVRPAN